MAAPNWRAMICIIGLTMAIHIRGNEIAVGVPEILRYTGSDILAGIGYSEDTQQMTAERCYNVIKISTSEQQSYVRLSQASSSSELESELGISVSLSGSYGEFSADAKANYLRSVEDNDYAMSLNYYEYSSNQVTAQLAGFGNDALTDSGKAFYEDGKNAYFGLVCGDYYVSSYLQGALLTMGLYIKFSSAVEKTEFEQEAGASFGSIMSASESIKSASSKRKFSGSITVHAFQMGGEPSKLSQVFNKNSTGDYYALTCSFTSMSDCIQTASGLLDYATNNFPKQFSFENNIGLSPLGTAFTQYQPIKRIGLIPAVSRVTFEVEQCRNELSNKLRANEYYRQKLHPFLNNGYPLKLVNSIIENVSSLSSVVNDNLRILMQSHGGAVDCYNDPDECKNIKTSMDSQLKDITKSDLAFLDGIKYILSLGGAVWYNTGENPETSWDILIDGSKKEFTRVKSVSVTSKHFNFLVKASDDPIWSMQYNSDAKSNVTYVGILCEISCLYPKNVTASKLLSPYFIELYNIAPNEEINEPDSSKKKIKLSFSVNMKKN